MENHTKLDYSNNIHTFEGIHELEEFVSTKEGALNIIEQLRGGAKSRWDYNLVREAILALIMSPKRRIYQVYEIPKGELSVFRARRLLKDETWFLREEDLGPLSPDKTTASGRCHRPKDPLCYCSAKPDIALSELNAELGDQFIIAKYLFKQEINAIPVGELDRYQRTDETYLGSANESTTKPFDDILQGQNAIIARLIDAFLADEFIKPATTSSDYNITSAFSDIILNDSDYSDKVDGLIYPSVVFRGGLNFAIKPNSLTNKMELIGADVIEITDVIGYGIFVYKQQGKLKSNNNGLLEWTDNI